MKHNVLELNNEDISDCNCMTFITSHTKEVSQKQSPIYKCTCKVYEIKFALCTCTRSMCKNNKLLAPLNVL